MTPMRHPHSGSRSESTPSRRRPRLLCGLARALSLAAIAWSGAAAGAEKPPTAQQPSGETSANLNYEIQNPIALIPRLPIENQLDFDQGPDDDSMTYALRPRPIIPFRLTDDLALITRTTFNIKYQDKGLTPGDSDEFGLGDTDMELYLSPRRTLAGGTLIFGAGPILRFDTTTNDALGSDKWGLGPAAVVVWQPARFDATSGWNIGFFVNHLFGVANSDNDELDLTYLQPTVSYTFEGGTSIGLDTQSTYDWFTNEWSVPINLTVGQLVELGRQPIVITLGGRYWAQTPSGGPDWGGQLSFNLVFDD